MKEQKIKFTPIPSTAEVKAERDRLAYRRRYLRVLRSTVYALLVVAAIAVLLATLFLPVLQVSGDSMNPTLQDKDIILLVKTGDMKTGATLVVLAEAEGKRVAAEADEMLMGYTSLK